MATPRVTVRIEVPDGTSDQVKRTVQRRSLEAGVLALWEEGVLSTRQAAAHLELDYQSFLDLLAARGFPVERGDLNRDGIEAAVQRLANRSEA